ncbi:MAG: hypothetical protein JEZ14_03250 [Marinilabiliaceae bacterium]|nr:hypothetical protein [Marinilabiliaceae bacterium]
MRLILFFLLICTPAFLQAQAPLSPQQQAWLYRIVQKTPILERNWGHYFGFDEELFLKVEMGQYHTDYDAVLQHQINKPESLQIDYDSIAMTSPGLISEAAIKLTLWELNEALKNCIYRPEQCRDSIYQYFSQPLGKALPSKLNSKHSRAVLFCVMHPSLPISKKIDQLTHQYKLEVGDQKKLLNKWRQLVTEYALVNSQKYFKLLSSGQSFDGITFLAAGEGSGTAGLLYETELNPQDSTKSWYGKGIGLFTYEVRIRKQGLRPLSQSTEQIELPAGKPSSLHISLWGLNSSFKPMIIITNGSKSYHLFADYMSRELSADPAMGSGISHLDRIEQYRTKKMEPLLKDLQKEGSLGVILQKEYGIKAEIETNLSRLEAEIDTLQKEENPSQPAIDYRKKLIDTNLTNLTKKERRITELESKLSGEYAKIASAEKKLTEMESLLGPNPQSWHKNKDHYLFKDGVVFNTRTQDLIFPITETPTSLAIQLLSAGYTLAGKQKDEVQIYVSLTDAPEKKEIIKAEPLHLQHTFFFYPDEYNSFTPLPDSLMAILKKAISNQLFIQAAIAPLPDSLKYPTTVRQSYPNRAREFEQPITTAGQNRKVELVMTQHGDTLCFTAFGSTDAVPTRLSMLDPELRSQLGITTASPHNNIYLSALRAMGIIKKVLLKSDPNHIIEVENLQQCEYEINEDTLRHLKKETGL